MGSKISPSGSSSSPARASAWFAISTYVSSGLVFISTPFFTRILTASEYGEVVLYNSWAVVFGIFATLSLHMGLFTNAMLDFEDDIDAYTSSTLGLTTVSVISCALIIFLITYFIGDFTELGPFLISFMLIGFLINAAFLFWQAQERFHYRYKLMVATSIPSAIAGVVLAVALVVSIGSHKAESRIVGIAVPTMLVGLFLYVKLLTKGRVFYSRKYWTYALTFAIPLLPHYLSQAFIAQFDRFAIEQASGKESVGVYGLACSLTLGVTMLWTALNASWTPWMLRKMKDHQFNDISNRSGDLLLAVAFVCSLVSLAAPELVRLLGPKSYAGSASAVPLLLLASFFQFGQSIFLNAQSFRRRSALIMQCSVVAAIINIGLNILLIPHYGFVAAAYVISVCQLFQLLFHYYFVQRVNKTKIVKGNWLIGITFMMLTVTLLSVVTQSIPYVRWLLFASLILLSGSWILKKRRRWEASPTPA